MPKIKTEYIAALAFVAALAVSMHANAQQRGQSGQGPVAQSCGNEIATLCPNASHGNRSVRVCLEANRNALSPACVNALNSTGGGRGMRQGAAPRN